MIEVNQEYPEVKINGDNLPLTKKEYDVFLFLWNNKNKTCTRNIIFSGIWGFNEWDNIRVIDTLIARLRKKLEPTHIRIVTRHGFGYSLVVNN